MSQNLNKYREFYNIFMAMPQFFVFTNESPKNTKENFCSNFLMEGWTSITPSPDCCICIAFSKDTHIGKLWYHMAIWPALYPFDHVKTVCYISMTLDASLIPYVNLMNNQTGQNWPSPIHTMWANYYIFYEKKWIN